MNQKHNYTIRYPQSYKSSFIVHHSLILDVLHKKAQEGVIAAAEVQKCYKNVLDESDYLGDGMYLVKPVAVTPFTITRPKEVSP